MGFLRKLFFGENQPLYGFTDTRQPGPGTQEFAFRPMFFLPPNSLMGYGGVNYGDNMKALAGPQIMHPLRVQDTSASGSGIIAGSVYGQPLLGRDNTGTDTSNATG